MIKRLCFSLAVIGVTACVAFGLSRFSAPEVPSVTAPEVCNTAPSTDGASKNIVVDFTRDATTCDLIDSTDLIDDTTDGSQFTNSGSPNLSRPEVREFGPTESVSPYDCTHCNFNTTSGPAGDDERIPKRPANILPGDPCTTAHLSQTMGRFDAGNSNERPIRRATKRAEPTLRRRL